MKYIYQQIDFRTLVEMIGTVSASTNLEISSVTSNCIPSVDLHRQSEEDLLIESSTYVFVFVKLYSVIKDSELLPM